ncbi:hypothetical protein BKA62DRAFT_712904 [Auriculariales sp. MPI-PUGE-AT-0066]|nr:hypothetical protein BKA62DRAFT_712904 [Auriculariales sp. MPI-PUGE-AT-0066]
MKFISLFVALAAAVSVFAEGPVEAGADVTDGPQAKLAAIQPGKAKARSFDAREALHEGRMTNAKRMALGLPPNAPVVRRHNTGTSPVQPPSPSNPVCKCLDGVVQISNSNNGKFLGYIGKNYELYGEYGSVKKENKALKVSLQCVSNKKSGPLQILGLNGDSKYPNIGGVVGYASTSNALVNYNYLYIGGVQQTTVGSTPVLGGSAFYDATGVKEKVESAIWHFNTNNRKITVEWVNPDGSSTSAKLVYYKPDGVLLAVADIKAFRAQFGGPTIPVVLTLVGN